ncbi:unnamed protein product, partial [Meganyctiphanes norvegica]
DCTDGCGGSNGLCTGPNSCTCNIGYKGSSCGSYDCPLGCGDSNGRCTGPNSCTCNIGYTGASCESWAVLGVQVENISVPEPAVVGHTARLECKWSGQDWYSIRWYKDDENIFTIIPKTKVKEATDDVHGVTVDVDSSNEYVVFLKDVVAATAGEYKCEVMGGKPHFVTSVLTKTLTVA